jgi:hypothetical protein
MASKFFAILTLGVGGIILADVLIHPTGTATAFNGVSAIAVPGINGLLGSTTKSPSSVKVG